MAERARGPTRYAIVAAVVVRGVAFCNLIAFATYGSQIDGLNGARGIIPAGTDDPTLLDLPIKARMWEAPSLWWLHPTFPDHPPKAVRVRRFLYTFTPAGAPSGVDVGRVWTRELITDAYCPTIGG